MAQIALLLVDGLTNEQIADVFEYCATVFDDPLFGLHMATTQDPEVFGCVTALCRSAPTIRAGILEACLAAVGEVGQDSVADGELRLCQLHRLGRLVQRLQYGDVLAA